MADRIELVVNDDQGKPDIGVQLARKMIDEDKVQLITGIVPSNIMLAVAHAVLPRKVFIVSVQAGPSAARRRRNAVPISSPPPTRPTPRRKGWGSI